MFYGFPLRCCSEAHKWIRQIWRRSMFYGNVTGTYTLDWITANVFGIWCENATTDQHSKLWKYRMHTGDIEESKLHMYSIDLWMIKRCTFFMLNFNWIRDFLIAWHFANSSEKLNYALQINLLFDATEISPLYHQVLSGTGI